MPSSPASAEIPIRSGRSDRYFTALRMRLSTSPADQHRGARRTDATPRTSTCASDSRRSASRSVRISSTTSATTSSRNSPDDREVAGLGRNRADPPTWISRRAQAGIESVSEFGLIPDWRFGPCGSDHPPNEHARRAHRCIRRRAEAIDAYCSNWPLDSSSWRFSTPPARRTWRGVEIRHGSGRASSGLLA